MEITSSKHTQHASPDHGRPLCHAYYSVVKANLIVSKRLDMLSDAEWFGKDRRASYLGGGKVPMVTVRSLRCVCGAAMGDIQYLGRASHSYYHL